MMLCMKINKNVDKKKKKLSQLIDYIACEDLR